MATKMKEHTTAPKTKNSSTTTKNKINMKTKNTTQTILKKSKTAKTTSSPKTQIATQTPTQTNLQNMTAPAALKPNTSTDFGTPIRGSYQPEDGEAYMNPKQKSYFKQLLLQRKQRLLEEIERTVHQLQTEALSLPDVSDRATQEEVFSLELRTRDRERKLVKKLDESLQKLEIDQYGYCDACGGHIGIHRLEARPMATLCIDCKTLDEIREKQQGGH